eukprot:501151-Prorocentrum_minimum.AAC.6
MQSTCSTAQRRWSVRPSQASVWQDLRYLRTAVLRVYGRTAERSMKIPTTVSVLTPCVRRYAASMSLASFSSRYVYILSPSASANRSGVRSTWASKSTWRHLVYSSPASVPQQSPKDS